MTTAQTVQFLLQNKTEACDGNANVALSQGRSDDIVEPNTNSQDVSAENTNNEDVSAENTNTQDAAAKNTNNQDVSAENTNTQDVSTENTNTQDVSDENSLDVSDNFKEHRDQLMIMSQELSELVQNSLDKLSSKQQINSKVCDLIESCGLEFRDLGRHLITVSKDIKKAYKANVEKSHVSKENLMGFTHAVYAAKNLH